MFPPWLRLCSICPISPLLSLLLILHFIYLLENVSTVVGGGEPMKIRPKQCSNAFGEEGTCMFVWECIKTEGKHLGTCADGFLFGSCCGHNDSANAIHSHMAEASSPVTIATTTIKIKGQQKPTVGLITTSTPIPQTTSTPLIKPVTLKPTIVQTILTILPANSTKPTGAGYVTPINYKPMTTSRPWQIFTGHPHLHPNKPIFASTYRPTYVSVGPVKNRPPIYFIRPTLRPMINVSHNHHLHYTPPPSPTNISHTSLVVTSETANSSGGKIPLLPGWGEGTIVLTSNLSPPRPSIPINEVSSINANNLTVVSVADNANNIGNIISNTKNNTEFILAGGNNESGSAQPSIKCM